MFSGLTSQVSSWMGKKNEEEVKSEEPIVGEESPTANNDETQPEAEVKKETSAGGSRLIGSVKSQMSSVSSWLSRKEEPPVPAPAPIPEEPPSSPVVKEDDDSSATGGADSEAGGSEGSGTPIDDPGAQNFGAATTKALAGAKSLGNLLYSAVNKAGKTVSEASAKIKKTVEENSILGEFNKEQEQFIKEKNKNGGAPVPPWVGCPNQEALREECLALSTDRRNFVRAPPEGVEFSFDMEREFSVCQAILQEDPNLEKMRFELVPKIINEENFWRNYLYRVNLICQAAEVSNMAESANVGGGPTETSAGDVRGLAETGFVSEEFPASSEDIKEVQEGMRKLGIKTDQESQEWEKELEAELQDYEMVGDKSIGNSDLIDSDIDDLK
ncbi:unnamed protein product [Nezara viridula]|uniref:BSD domain-containing protein n=1 Tax=Nezara viridula TaxID=85310 RepID=A0A9P0HH41_NEZVI|nr:unnamed protein product [Nezara viridula]